MITTTQATANATRIAEKLIAQGRSAADARRDALRWVLENNGIVLFESVFPPLTRDTWQWNGWTIEEHYADCTCSGCTPQPKTARKRGATGAGKKAAETRRKLDQDTIDEFEAVMSHITDNDLRGWTTPIEDWQDLRVAAQNCLARFANRRGRKWDYRRSRWDDLLVRAKFNIFHMTGQSY